MLDHLANLLDPYALKARLMPGLFALLPLALAALALFPEEADCLRLLLGTAVAFGGATFLGQAARDRGKKLEPGLFSSWGGMPSVALLRHRNKVLNPATKARYHRNLGDLIPGLVLPTAEEEEADRREADRRYGSCCDFLRERTRCAQSYPLLFAENISYGTRRNFLGLRPYGLGFSILGMLLSLLALALSALAGESMALPLLGSVGGLVCTLIWSLGITRSWVRLPAFAYAERLLATSDHLNTQPTGE